MHKKIIGLLALTFCAVAAFAMAGCSSQEEYAPSLGEPTLALPAIGEEGVLRVGVNTQRSPLAGQGNEKIIGIDVDIASAIADELGLKVDLQDVGADADKALAEGEVDIVMGQESVDETEGVWHSEQYLPTGVVLFAKEGSGAQMPTGAVTPKIAAQISSKSAWAVTNAFGEEALASTGDLATAFSDLSNGSVDYVASDAVIGMYAANLQDVPVEVVCLMDTASGYCIGAKSDNTELQEAIQGALTAIIDNGLVGVIEDKWLGTAVVLTDVPKVEAKAKATDANEPEGGAEATEENAEASSSSSSSDSGTSLA